ncbi:MAG: hypothetical protein ACREUU_10740 [Gammaproteobacteria bacterium]
MPIAIWTAFVIIALLFLDVLRVTVYGALVPAAALVLLVTVVSSRPLGARAVQLRIDRRDVAAVVACFLLVVALFRLAFSVFTVARVTGLFLGFAAGLVVGVAGPLIYTVWIRRRPLASLGIGFHNWRRTVALGLVFASVQFFVTLWRYDLPRPVDWVPLLVMSITVGVFESIFFRGSSRAAWKKALEWEPAFSGRLLSILSITLVTAWPVGRCSFSSG